MCGIIGFVGNDAATYINAGLSFLQHRGQDSAGIATLSKKRVFIEKGHGLADKTFTPERVANLKGDIGIGHVRYSTVGSPRVLSEIQPFYVNQPYGITLAHNGNLTNYKHLRHWLTSASRRHMSSDSDSEVLLNVLAHCVAEEARGRELTPALLFAAVTEMHKRCAGSYSAVALFADGGLLAFRDPNGVRPLSFGGNENRWLFASESAAFRPLGFRESEDIAPGEAVFIDCHGRLHRQACVTTSCRRPCVFEYIYLARPDSRLEGASVYAARLNMGRKLAEKIRRDHADLKIDCVVPVPDSGRIAAMQLAHELGVPYREGLVKNRYVGRTFITAGQNERSRSVRRKLNIIESEFIGKKVLLVDDSIVRGTTSRELVELARTAGAEKVYFASASPPVRYPNVYGIDIPTRAELIAGHRDEAEIAAYLGADSVIYQSLPDLLGAVREANPSLKDFETSCFDGDYRVGEIDDLYLEELEKTRNHNRDNDLMLRELPLI